MTETNGIPVDLGVGPSRVPDQVREIPDMRDVYTYRVSIDVKVGASAETFRVYYVDAANFAEARALANLLAGATNDVLEVTQLPNGSPIDLVHTSTLVVKTKVYVEHTAEFHAAVCNA